MEERPLLEKDICTIDGGSKVINRVEKRSGFSIQLKAGKEEGRWVVGELNGGRVGERD